ncbi:hypothetical protein [Deinococcus marmoris]|uniref:N-acetyltransferase domain-containing protein n=1 Tax=Deinococcus marmoris TaxID=249408 RepID=A0A1U7NV92_9DEIO|nr:hypothetical protein [Deinococcus marmoris]OLV16826.1 hypothetical protein BOO71_0010687 [Deinococcus marmoris]
MLPAVLSELIDYFAPLSTFQREEGGAVTLLTPGVNVLGLNATYLPEVVPDLRSALAWHEVHELPPLLASLSPVAGAQQVSALEVGTFTPVELQESGIVVEQISRLHMQKWADVLTAAYGTPEWATLLAQHLAARLEGQRDYLLLLAYDGAGEVVGALLWHGIKGKGAAHLWGVTDETARLPLLNAAWALAEGLRVSVLPGDVSLSETTGVFFGVSGGE